MSKGLGRGFGALLASEEANASPVISGDSVRKILLTEISANPHQPRKEFDPQALQELSDSIKENGIIQPILVEAAPNGYQIVAGERRYRAAKMAGLSEIPAIVRSFSDEERMEIALIENIQRSDLTPLEEARAYRHIMDSFQYTQEVVAQKVGKQRSTVANALRLLKLPDYMQNAVEKGELTAGHARAILSLDKEQLQSELYKSIVKEGLNVREAEQRASALNSGSGKTEAVDGVKKVKDPELGNLEQKLIDHFGTKVSVKGNGRKGSIEIAYFSEDDLNRVIEVLQLSL